MRWLGTERAILAVIAKTTLLNLVKLPRALPHPGLPMSRGTPPRSMMGQTGRLLLGAPRT